MELKLTSTWDKDVDRAIEIAKEHKLRVVFIRDGEHGTADLYVVAKFQQAGFEASIVMYEGQYDKNALRVTFYPKEEQ